MTCYPLPKNYRFSKNQSSGTFLKRRGDRVHCGIDLYAPEKTPVFAVDNGVIKYTGEFTNPKLNPYWNITYEIILETDANLFFRYAELKKVLVKKNQKVNAGECIGLVGQVLNSDKINHSHPDYIQRLAKEDKLSMLHFEMYNCYPEKSKLYLGGNWFAEKTPKGLMNPTDLLQKMSMED